MQHISCQHFRRAPEFRLGRQSTADGEDFELPTAEVGVVVEAEAEGEIEQIVFGPGFGAGEGGPIGAGGRSVRPGDAAPTGAGFGIFDGEAEVFFFDGARRGGEANATGEEKRFGVAVAEGAEAGEGGEKGGGELGEAEFGIAVESLGEGGIDVLGGGVALQTIAQEGNAVGGKGEADGMGVAAEAGKEVAVRVGGGPR